MNTFWSQSEGFIEELARYLKGKRVLEVYSGNGFAAKRLSDLGVDIKATGLSSSYFSSDSYVYPIEEMESSDATLKYQDHDILLMMWPEANADATIAYLNFINDFSRPKEVIFIGEYSSIEKKIWGGCATDEFFLMTNIKHEFQKYKGNHVEKAMSLTLKSRDELLDFFKNHDFKYFHSKFASKKNQKLAIERLMKFIFK